MRDLSPGAPTAPWAFEMSPSQDCASFNPDWTPAWAAVPSAATSVAHGRSGKADLLTWMFRTKGGAKTAFLIFFSFWREETGPRDHGGGESYFHRPGLLADGRTSEVLCHTQPAQATEVWLWKVTGWPVYIMVATRWPSRLGHYGEVSQEWELAWRPCGVWGKRGLATESLARKSAWLPIPAAWRCVSREHTEPQCPHIMHIWRPLCASLSCTRCWDTGLPAGRFPQDRKSSQRSFLEEFWGSELKVGISETLWEGAFMISWHLIYLFFLANYGAYIYFENELLSIKMIKKFII